jgi:hypothetical protein
MAPSSQPVTASIIFNVRPPQGVNAFKNFKPGRQRVANMERINKEVVVGDLRGKEDSVSLDTAGFQLYHHPSRHKAFTSDAEIKREYYPESIELIKQLTGATKVVLFDHSMSPSIFQLSLDRQ